MIPWRDPTWRREYSISLFGIRTQSPYFLLTIIMLLKAITERLALEMSLAFITFGYTYDEISLTLTTNTIKWEDVKNKIIKKIPELPEEFPGDMGAEMLIPILLAGELMRNPNLGEAKTQSWTCSRTCPPKKWIS